MPAKKQQQQRRVLISLVMELCQKNLGRQAEVNPDKNCACEGVVHLQNKAVYCASRTEKGCVGERSVRGLLQIFLQAVVQLLWTADKMCILQKHGQFENTLYIQAPLNLRFHLKHITG